ncbi:MAG: hypothetical protein ACK5HS_01540 [Mycoplasmatales bacterium]
MITNINKLITYANDNNILNPRDNAYIYNQLCYFLDITPSKSFETCQYTGHIDDLLELMVKDKHFKSDTLKELYKTKIIDIIIPFPSTIEDKFYKEFAVNSKSATDYFFQHSKLVNYIKEKQISKNISYKVNSKYGEIDITINLSKPEKTLEEIKLAKEQKKSDWPSCFLCKEQEGLYGSILNPDRSNHRLIELMLNNKKWYFQYSPYSYFNEHSILLSDEHKDMIINEQTFSNLLEFVDMFPHYMIGSNADIPIVGGSMLTHDHYQCGNYDFPLFRANSVLEKTIDTVDIYSVKWPLHTVKLVSSDKVQILEQSTKILDKWQSYEDKEHNIIAHTSAKHNTITPIVRFNNNKYEMYLILRNNLTNEDNKFGLFHIDPKRFNIKQENIGLIEAIGLAVLPSRLEDEFNTLLRVDVLPEELKKHKELFDHIKNIKVNKKEELYKLVGNIFVECLEDCGVFKYNTDKYIEFIRSIND